MAGGGRYPPVMLTRDDVRRIALDQPEAYEADHHGMPSFRVGKKIFCTIHQDRPRAMLKLDPEDQRNLSEADPGVVEPVPGYWGRSGSTFIWFEKIETGRFADLMAMGWAQVAPKRLLAAVSTGVYKDG
ncbi:MAG: MmcQ/YjbR family DNA-binding protein [Phenylobacterium sp.]|nr:MmcQ/YjbR family DNA-binding protein [Phenylobacterium sp.]